MAGFEFLPEAEAEFIEQIAYYAGIRRELGLRFQEAVAQAIAAQAEGQSLNTLAPEAWAQRAAA
jgi:predicted HicB family RNase H-like nuclease